MSTVATSYLSAVLAARVYLTTGSAFLSVLVFAIQWLPPLIFAGLAPRLLTQHTPGAVLRFCEFGNAISAVLLFWFDWQLAILAVLVLRGVLETVIRVARSTAVKQLISEDRLGKVTAHAAMAQYVGAVGGGALGILLGFGTSSLYAIVGIGLLAIVPLFRIYGDTVTHAQSGSSFREVLARARRALAGNSILARSIALFATTTIFFQGFITVARTEIAFAYTPNPEDWFFWVQQITSLSIIAGALFVSLYWAARKERVNMLAVAVASCAVLAAFPLLEGVIAVLALFAVFVFAFEVCFLRFSIEINYHCAPDQIADVNAMVYAFVTLGMATLTLAAAWAVETVPLAYVGLAMAVMCLALLAVIGRFKAR
ncbi:MAG: hypothetical protein QNJ09_02385 [Paracoccaceae bacterium]|nr:hypothetical protein [Paracoccaceae bacterium]